MIIPILAFAIALLIVVLFSKAIRQTALSAAVIFLIIGFILGGDGLHLAQINADDKLVSGFVQVALFSVLFADGMKIGAKDLISAWKLPGRALLLGLPLSLLFMAVLAHFVLDLGWLGSFLVAAVLSPTDPVFASAFVSRKEVPRKLRRLLNVESGLNDGLALPFVLLILSLFGVEQFKLLSWIGELLIGVAVGVVIPLGILKLQRFKLFSVSDFYRPMLGLSIGLIVYIVTSLLQGNHFLAGFSAGITIATVDPEIRQSFWGYAEPIAELLKLAAVLIFGALLSWRFFVMVGWRGYLYVILVLFLARPLALILSLIASPLNWSERLAAAWFGPRGFASVVYGLLVLGSGVPRAPELFRVISIVIVGSMIAHSTTDTPIARWFKEKSKEQQKPDEQDKKNEEVSQQQQSSTAEEQNPKRPGRRDKYMGL
jgi:sodium/hydrogen antiporter